MTHKYPKPLQAGSRPTPPGIPNPTCPILLEAKAVLDKAQDLHRAIRRLRRSTQRCPTCPERAECPTMLYFAQAVDTAIREVRQEWGLDKE
jgi:hypothetical protein